MHNTNIQRLFMALCILPVHCTMHKVLHTAFAHAQLTIALWAPLS